MSKTIGVAILAKNEEKLIGRCLDTVRWADQIVVVDTGSQDRTIEIAREFGAETHLDFVWTDNFSEAQNHAKSKMKTDWIISIDCDEILLSTEEEVRQAVELAKDTVRVTMIADGTPENTFGFPRLFRNCPEIYWQEPIHKVLNISGEGEPVGNVRIQYSYSPAHQNDPDRSLRILEQQARSEQNPSRTLFYLGREYFYKKRYRDCVDTLNRYIAVGYWAAEVAEAYLTMAKSYVELKEIEPAAAACLQAIKINSNFKEAIEYMATISTPDNAPQWKRMARTADNRDLIWKRVEAGSGSDSVFISVHNDDESLFGAYTLMRERPLVIVATDSYIQPERGDVGCDAQTRRAETIEAMRIAGCPVVFLGIKDTELTEQMLAERLKGLSPEKVYVPARQGGNTQHDIVHDVARRMFGDRCRYYSTYTKTELYTTGRTEIAPTPQERELKGKMLACYSSQLYLPSTRPHFEAVVDKPEWLSEPLKKVLITPYFGDLPEWFDKFRAPEGYTWILDTDLEGFKKRVRDKLGIEYPAGYGSSKIHDYRCAFGLLYWEEIKAFDYWGTMDLDMVFGDVDKWFSDYELSKLDIWSNHPTYVSGPWSLYRNVDYVNKLFMENPAWELILRDKQTTAWVEGDYSRMLERSSLSYRYSDFQGNPYNPPFNLKKVNGRLYQDGEEIPLLHFRRDKRWVL